MFGEEVEPAVERAITAAIAAAAGGGHETDAGREEGALDDLVLLQLLLEDADESILRAIGSRTQVLLRSVRDAQRQPQAPPGHGLPLAEDVVHFAAGEAVELGGYGEPVAGVHVLLALFAFHGSRSEELLRAGGLDWRPLRSVTRRQWMRW